MTVPLWIFCSAAIAFLLIAFWSGCKRLIKPLFSPFSRTQPVFVDFTINEPSGQSEAYVDPKHQITCAVFGKRWITARDVEFLSADELGMSSHPDLVTVKQTFDRQAPDRTRYLPYGPQLGDAYRSGELQLPKKCKGKVIVFAGVTRNAPQKTCSFGVVDRYLLALVLDSFGELVWRKLDVMVRFDSNKYLFAVARHDVKAPIGLLANHPKAA